VQNPKTNTCRKGELKKKNTAPSRREGVGLHSPEKKTKKRGGGKEMNVAPRGGGTSFEKSGGRNAIKW